ncbi:hypothetical protein Acsp03_03850 [Actinomadura sp. NBRC 104412]|uniref:hypothetical protein n=1 Tax=Actinomadura sp. NBRC 104412 TaxID=3032203 RepID=UPI0024A053C2|nr:hypothetical protein [Actinomadura sp. NBRC 104412]GLZ02918.1 hypothetical protein Acsp03_03850 [Actinomadura sp. NBRC 104412]
MSKQNKGTSRKAAPKTGRGGSAKPGDKLRMQGHGADRPGAADERIAQPAGAEARDAAGLADERRAADRDRTRSDVRDARRENR